MILMKIILNLHCCTEPNGLNTIVAWWHYHSLSLAFTSQYITVAYCHLLCVTVIHCHLLCRCRSVSSIVSLSCSVIHCVTTIISVVRHATVIHYAIHSLSSIVSLSPTVILCVVHSLWMSFTLSLLFTHPLYDSVTVISCRPLWHCHPPYIPAVHCVSAICSVTAICHMSLPSTL